MAEISNVFAPPTPAREKIHEVASVKNLSSVQIFCNGCLVDDLWLVVSICVWFWECRALCIWPWRI